MEDLPDTLTPLTNECVNEGEITKTPLAWGRLISCISYLESVDLVKTKISLGRSEVCDIVVHKSKFIPTQVLNVSKEHFEIRKEDSVIYIYDKSKNGTFLNENLIGRGKKNVLQDEDQIAVGHKNMKVYIYKSLFNTDEYLPLELKRNYEPIKVLGRGACGEVRLAIEKKTCRMYAIKKIIKGPTDTSQIHHLNHPTKILTEINILKALNHPFVIGMKDIVDLQNEVFIVLEYMKGGELTNRILSIKPLSESCAKFLFYQMVLAVQYLHSQEITHRDIKPENILLYSDDDETLIKVSDFGLSKVLRDNEAMQTMCGTLCYVAPEVLNVRFREYGEYGKQVDIWSLGVVLYYMLSKTLPFQDANRETLAKKIVYGAYTTNSEEWHNVSREAKDLVKSMLTVNPKLRIGIEGILRHQWLYKDISILRRVRSLMNKVELLNYEDCSPVGPTEKRMRISKG